MSSWPWRGLCVDTGTWGAKKVVTDLDVPGGQAVVDNTGGEAISLHQDVSIEAAERRFGPWTCSSPMPGSGACAKLSRCPWPIGDDDGGGPRWRVPFGEVRRARDAPCRGRFHCNLSSVAGLRASAGLAGYCATKGGVRLFAKAVAMECAAADDGIRVNTVHPGMIDAPIWTKLPASTGRNEAIDPNEIANAGVPLRRAGQAQDIANGVLFLASDESS
jgi:hypothetical protein